MMSVRSNWPMLSALMRKYACSGMSTCTPSGTQMNDPPDHTAEFSAAKVLSPGGMTVAQCSRKRSGCSRSAVSVSQKMTPFSSRSSRMEW